MQWQVPVQHVRDILWQLCMAEEEASLSHAGLHILLVPCSPVPSLSMASTAQLLMMRNVVFDQLFVLLVQIGGVQASASWITALACDLGPASLPGASPMLLMTVGTTDGAVALHGAPASELGSPRALAVLWAPHGSGKPHLHPCCICHKHDVCTGCSQICHKHDVCTGCSQISGNPAGIPTDSETASDPQILSRCRRAWESHARHASRQSFGMTPQHCLSTSHGWFLHCACPAPLQSCCIASTRVWTPFASSVACRQLRCLCCGSSVLRQNY